MLNFIVAMKRVILSVFLLLIVSMMPLQVTAQGTNATPTVTLALTLTETPVSFVTPWPATVPTTFVLAPTPLPRNNASITMREIGSSLGYGTLIIILVFLFFGLTLRLRRD